MTSKIQKIKRNLAVNSDISRRTHSLRRGGFTFHEAMETGRRDIYKIGGYKESLDFEDHYTVAKRTIGRAGIEILPNKAWSVNPIIKDGDNDGNTTAFEKDVQRLINEFKLFSVLKDLNIKARTFQYAGIWIVVREREEASPNKEMIPVGGVDSLVRLTALYQDRISAESQPTITDLSSPDYGYPEFYEYNENVVSNQSNNDMQAFQIHHSRIVTFGEGAPTDSIYGTPVNEAGFNYIQNCEKVLAAAPEGFIKNARAATIFSIDDPTIANAMKTDKFKEEWEKSEAEFHAGINTSRVVGGMKVNPFQVNLADPENTFMINLNCYAATLRVAGTIIIGHQMGERASGEDMDRLIEDAKGYQHQTITPEIIMPVLNRLIKYKIINKPSSMVTIKWPDIAEPAKSDKIALVEQMQKANETALKSRQPAPFPSAEENRELAGLPKLDGEYNVPNIIDGE